MQRRNRFNLVINILEGILILFAVLFAVFFVRLINDIQGNANVVNYAGYVRGSTQRLVKLELAGQPSDALIVKLDDLIDSLQNGGGEYNIRKISAPGFVSSLSKQTMLWEALKEEIFKARETGANQTKLFALSEDYFELADRTVREVQTFSDDKASNLQAIEMVFIADMSVIVILLVYKSVAGILLTRKNRALNDMAFLDAHTGLPNKRKCDNLLLKHSELNQNAACIMFDLNNLKTVNDTAGHKAGDMLILSFASIIRRTMPEDVFVGRYGGDEFIAVLFDRDESTVKQLLGSVEENVRLFNEEHKDISIRYAAGYQMSDGCDGCSLQMLLHKADQKMYADKEKKKRLQSA